MVHTLQDILLIHRYRRYRIYQKLQDFRRKQRLTRHIGMKIMTIFINFGLRKQKDSIFGSS